jgi:clan AA aspartic protease (TIGR02281 family)
MSAHPLFHHGRRWGWCVLAAAAFVGISIHHPRSGVVPVPGHAPPAAGDELTILADEHGQFWPTVKANGVKLRVLADTGATEIVFPREDVWRLGINPRSLTFDQPHSTANGTVYGAPFRLDRLVIGGCVVRDVQASINGAPMDMPLMGMSVLQRFPLTIANGVMTLRC